MIRSLRCGALCLLLAAAPALVACDDPAAPDDLGGELPPADVGGSFVLVRAAGESLERVCFPPIDPPQGDRMSLGLLSFDTARSVLRQQEVRLGCLGNPSSDSVVVDQERPFRIRGPLVLVDRPASAAGAVVDTGAVAGNTLVVRRNKIDLVYERVARSGAVFFYRASDVNSWTVGTASFGADGAGGSTWGVSMEPTHFSRNQRLYFFRPAGRPAAGTYQVGNYTSAPFYARMPRESPTGGAIFESVSGTVTLTESTPERISGSFTIDLVDGAGHPTRVEGRLVARCACP